jgi:hypothetical protein
MSLRQGRSFSLVFIASYILQVAMHYEYFLPFKQQFSHSDCSSHSINTQDQLSASLTPAV